MDLFIMNNKNYSNRIIVGSYEVNSQDEYSEFQDGNGKYHRNILRERISGSFEMRFLNTSDYNSFIKILMDYKIAGYNHASFFVNNKNKVVAGDFFFTITPKLSRHGNGTKQYETFKVIVEER